MKRKKFQVKGMSRKSKDREGADKKLGCEEKELTREREAAKEKCQTTEVSRGVKRLFLRCGGGLDILFCRFARLSIFEISTPGDYLDICMSDWMRVI